MAVALYREGQIPSEVLDAIFTTPAPTAPSVTRVGDGEGEEEEKEGPTQAGMYWGKEWGCRILCSCEK